jgi:hypothetical protein
MRGDVVRRRFRTFAFAGAVAGPFQLEEARATASVAIKRRRTERAQDSEFALRRIGQPGVLVQSRGEAPAEALDGLISNSPSSESAG